jgi:hypothetical protein
MNYARSYPRFWLTYFVLSVVATGVGLLAEIFAAITGNSSVQALLGVAFGVLALVPLYGFVRQRRVSTRLLATCLLAGTSIATAVVLFILLFTVSLHGLGSQLLLGFVAVGTAVPYLFAVYQYAFKSPHIWQHAT